jgi:hypothetical protein
MCIGLYFVWYTLCTCSCADIIVKDPDAALGMRRSTGILQRTSKQLGSGQRCVSDLARSEHLTAGLSAADQVLREPF